MKLTSRHLDTLIFSVVFTTVILATVYYCSLQPHVPTCEEQGGTYKLVGYERIHGSGKWLHAKYKCELPE